VRVAPPLLSGEGDLEHGFVGLVVEEGEQRAAEVVEQCWNHGFLLRKELLHTISLLAITNNMFMTK
jgi:hypothetical protein